MGLVATTTSSTALNVVLAGRPQDSQDSQEFQPKTTATTKCWEKEVEILTYRDFLNVGRIDLTPPWIGRVG